MRLADSPDQRVKSDDAVAELLGAVVAYARESRVVSAPIWCNVVHQLGESPMATNASQTAASKPEQKTTRASVSFPNDLYATLEKIAEEKKVSVAWVVRDAAEKYVNEQWPLLAGRG